MSDKDSVPHTLDYLDEDSHAVSEAAYIFKNGYSFANLDKQGGISPAIEATGLYINDTQIVGTWQTALPGDLLKLKSRESSEENTDLHVQYENDSIKVDRSVLVADGRMQEMLSITNTTDHEITTPVQFTFGTSFTDIFTIRGDKNLKTGVMTVAVNDSGVKFSHAGLTRDENVKNIRQSDFSFSMPPEKIEPSGEKNAYTATFNIVTAPGATQSIIMVGGKPLESPIMPSEPFYKAALAKSRSDFWDMFNIGAWVESSNPEYNEILKVAQKDMALMVTKYEDGQLYPFAGLPWFANRFGRDAIVTGVQLLDLKPEILRDTLTFQGKMQATKTDYKLQSQPGKIFHEIREGESSLSGQNPFQHYYGGIDTTLLFINAHYLLFKRTRDLEYLKQEWPHIEMAISWMKEYGDLDGDGLIEHEVPAEGLTVQSWMDSGDSMNDENNKKPTGPLAVCEVQGHAYLAYKAGARMAEILCMTSDAELYESHAEMTKKAFNENFWDDDIGYVRAVDGLGPNKRKIMIKGSNPGQALHDIMTDERRDKSVKILMGPDLFSGWGVRTVAEGQPGFNPLAYHRGSIWGHDNAIIVTNMMNTHRAESMTLMKSLVEAAKARTQKRLAELFSGVTRVPEQGPEPYPASNEPQTWASAGQVQMLCAAIGITPDPVTGSVSFKYTDLPEWMGTITIHNLKVGEKTLPPQTVNPSDGPKKPMAAPVPEPA